MLRSFHYETEDICMPDFIHQFVPGRSSRTLLLLHGTGGNETDLIPLGRELDPEAALLSLRGQVLENGMPRFFRRLAEGVFDEDDLVRRAHQLADFVGNAARQYDFDQQKLLAVGYSNGANIASAVLLLRPGTLSGGALLRAMIPLVPNELPDLKKAPVLIAAGNFDPIIPAENAQRLAELHEHARAEVSRHLDHAGHNLTSDTLSITKQSLGERP
ncbi:MAG: alpha/beta hydrolase [Chthoniobacterales bacterium]